MIQGYSGQVSLMNFAGMPNSLKKISLMHMNPIMGLGSQAK
jgi:hypothetical protein